MLANWSSWLTGRATPTYGRRPPVVLINGLAEQSESWFCNLPAWRRHFDVYTPNLLVYQGETLHRRIAGGLPIDIDYLVGQLHTFLESFVQRPPYHLVANSLGGKVAVEYAVRHPEQVGRVVLLCPSGLSDEERLPVVEGVRRSDVQGLVDSVFYRPGRVHPRVVAYYRQQFADRRWRAGLLRTVRGTMGHRVRDRLSQVKQPTLLVVGREDRIVDPGQTVAAATRLPRGEVVLLPRCGHAPQMEKARLINRLVVDFLTRPNTPETT